MNDISDERIKNLLKVQSCLIPLCLILYFLNLNDILILVFKMVVSYSFSVIFMLEFEKYLDNIDSRFNPDIKGLEYILSILFALIIFLIIELIIDKNEFIFTIIIILIVLCGYVINLFFRSEKKSKSIK